MRNNERIGKVSLGRCATYVFALLPALGIIGDTTAVAALVGLQMVMLDVDLAKAYDSVDRWVKEVALPKALSERAAINSFFEVRP